MTKAYLKKLLEYCPTGTAEGEIKIRSDVFVQFPEFIDLIIPPSHSPLILLGQKGSGKSLLVDFSIDVLRAKKIACVTCRGNFRRESKARFSCKSRQIPSENCFKIC